MFHHFLGHYEIADSSTCESLGMSVIDTLKECKEAAIALLLPNTVPYEKQFEDRPIGCIQNPVSDWLGWAEPTGHPNSTVECGSLSNQNRNYNCICRGMKYINKNYNQIIGKVKYCC